MAIRPSAADQLPLGDLPNTRYPDPRVEALDKKFKYKVGNAAIERIATGFRWAEGPVYFRDGGYLLWSDIPNNRIMRWLEEDGHVSVFRTPSNYSNGNTRDREGRLITCEHDARRVTRTEPDGSITVLMDSFQGKKLNAPNDVVVASDGAIWFTDPGYGIDGYYEGHKDMAELPRNTYRLSIPRPAAPTWWPATSRDRTGWPSRRTKRSCMSSTAASRMAARLISAPST
jgi:gluconolactonase